ncbi:hypothetical protein FisN_20Lh123 [Fistulifera solaris]|uniref:RAD50-interacting protein 1 n=1 Tax=Fistulifera solaris TaxID=1519565 RepID=A0A1Z5JCU1_FISSO|nr:hypothetical protein FisN_20Lh123 [Fistulifera solaris]|eukprot:GAX11823.1 hypothetical protein FisN_20Lh123 [Fistulifera solaris]
MPDPNEVRSLLPRQALLLSQVEELSLWHAVTQLAHRHPEPLPDDKDNNTIEDNDSSSSSSSSSSSIVETTMEALEQLLTQSTTASRSFVQRLAEQEYLPWQHYYQSLYQKQLRTFLQDYPQQCPEASPQLTQVCRMLQRLLASETRLRRHLGIYQDKTSSIVVHELMRPWVQRLLFHFVTYDPERPTTFRTERLTEWLFSYVQTHIFDSGVWDLVQSILSQDSALFFLEELVQLLQYVLTKRNVFRDNVHPQIFMKHVEQLFLFDETMPDTKVRRLVDVFVVGDVELWDWWLQNEQQLALATLEDSEENTSHSMTTCAELVCARFRSMQKKASLVSLRSMYVSSVMAPFGTKLLDVWQEKALQLHPTDCIPWSEWIQGTHLIVDFLQQHPPENEVTNDLWQFAVSLQGLENAIVEDLFAKTLVERVLLNEAKLASYLVRCSFLVASNEEEDDDGVELMEVRQVLTRFYQETVVHETAGPLPEYSFQRMRESVLSLLAEQFLQVALNADGMTLELAESGSRVFAHQVQSVFGIFSTMTELPLTVQRLLDVTRWMSMEYSDLSGVGNALCVLAGIPAPLTMDPFVQDDRLAEEAVAMLQAKGFISMELADAISILNRRVDLLGA